MSRTWGKWNRDNVWKLCVVLIDTVPFSLGSFMDPWIFEDFLAFKHHQHPFCAAKKLEHVGTMIPKLTHHLMKRLWVQKNSQERPWWCPGLHFGGFLSHENTHWRYVNPNWTLSISRGPITIAMETSWLDTAIASSHPGEMAGSMMHFKVRASPERLKRKCLVKGHREFLQIGENPTQMLLNLT